MPGDSFYRNAPWRRYRAAFLAAHPMCATPGCNRPAQVVDHIIPRSAGGPDLDPANTQAMCFSCHNRKTRRHDQPHVKGKYELPTIGCDALGLPRDFKHHWRKG